MTDTKATEANIDLATQLVIDRFASDPDEVWICLANAWTDGFDANETEAFIRECKEAMEEE